MRKVILFSIVLLFSFISHVNADTNYIEKTMTIQNTGTTVNWTFVNTTNYTSGIVPGYHAITGFTAFPNTKAATNYFEVGLYDAVTNGTLNSARLFGEAIGVANSTGGQYYVYPRMVEYGLAVGVAPNTTVVIEYTH